MKKDSAKLQDKVELANQQLAMLVQEGNAYQEVIEKIRGPGLNIEVQEMRKSRKRYLTVSMQQSGRHYPLPFPVYILPSGDVLAT